MGKWSLRVINLLSIWELDIHLHYTMKRLICIIMLARTRDCGILNQISLGWDSPIIQNLVNFLCLVNTFSNARISRYDLNKLSTTTFKLGKYNDNHIPTCMFDNKAYFLSHNHPLHFTTNDRPCPTKCWLIMSKALLTLVKSNLIHWNTPTHGSWPSYFALSVWSGLEWLFSTLRNMVLAQYNILTTQHILRVGANEIPRPKKLQNQAHLLIGNTNLDYGSLH